MNSLEFVLAMNNKVLEAVGKSNEEHTLQVGFKTVA